MDIEEANKVLEELSKDARPEMVNDKAKRLFDAIMKIADERDEAKSDLYEVNNRINDLLEIADNKDKIIKKMANEIYITSIRDDGTHFSTRQEVIDYFTKKVSEK